MASSCGSQVHVAQLFIYPIKSCGGIAVTDALVTKNGFLHDRYWVITDEAYHTLTQREVPRLVLVKPRIVEHPEEPGLAPYLAITAVGYNAPELRLSLYPTVEETSKFKPCQVSIWKDTVSGYDMGDEAAQWLGEFLGRPVRLIRRAENEVRHSRVNAPAPKLLEAPAQTAFADDAPFLLASTESLQDVNERLDKLVDIRNFRPNIVVTGGGQPFTEETWKRVQVVPQSTPTNVNNTVRDDTATELYVTARCTRCVMTTNDPDEGVLAPNHQPLKTLMGYRRVDPGAKYNACFGMNCVPANLGQVIRVNDRVIICETGLHRRVAAA
ncbi:hypothetical protein IWQ62_000958 [Dispira parvispora]|uniref:MOSC domain-containing protein n=1 Tax=Dispira parvispora TaxID=1520584 RepID=A0A9W8AW29_9FUNG|nr:hypothetical protein IWQ62_000958 [Dispira parvispora]